MLRIHTSQFGVIGDLGGAWRLPPLAAIAAASLLAACSADISRLERPGTMVAERAPMPSEPIRRNAGGPPAYDNSGWPDSGPRDGALPPRTDRVTSLPQDRVVALPDASAPVNPSVPYDAPPKPKTAVQAAGSPVAQASGSKSAPIAAGATIEVQQGDSLFALAKKHHVSIAALMEVNGLKNANLRPGQRLVLPSRARRPMVKTAAVPVATPVGQAVSPPMHAAPLPNVAAAEWHGSYAVKAGDSLYGIARAHKVTVAELQRQNGMTDTKLKPGQALKVPEGADAPQVTATEPPRALTPVVTPALPVASAPAAPASGGPRILNPPATALRTKDVSEAAQPAPVKVAGPTSAATATSAVKFRWPARGALLAGFGKRPDGAQNDGINIAVAKGTDITAADAGTVAYAGSEIKAYGNLVLLRHEGGWVTAYAHADQILVKRGDTVTRGQVIAKAGTSGSVDQPQVHFELRQGSKPVDPTPHMEK